MHTHPALVALLCCAVVELYDPSRDIREATNVAARFPERTRAMRAAIEKWKSEVTPR